jgi:hypothetical protein
MGTLRFAHPTLLYLSITSLSVKNKEMQIVLEVSIL